MFFENKIANSLSGRTLFDIVKSLYGKTKTTVLPSFSSMQELVTRFSDFFVGKVRSLRNSLDDLNPPSPTFETFHGKIMSNFKPVTSDFVKELILSSSPKTCNLDPLPTNLLFGCIDNIVDSITLIINESLCTGIVPSCFKHAIVSPLLKKPGADPDILKNYRPVSNLPFISKILEKIVALQIAEHLEEFSLLEVNQSAYRKLHNTETALLKIFDDLLTNADNMRISVLVMLDLSAAFDTIDHTILGDRLGSLGFGGSVLNWFHSYLTNRTQSVSINDITSDPVTLEFGVPQGSVLGPILYTIYTTSLGKLIREHDIDFHMYADDTQIYMSMDTLQPSHEKSKLETCLKSVKDWMLSNKLKLNDEKTEVIVCNPRQFVFHFDSILIGEQSIEPSHCARNLGVFIDNKLNMNDHISHMCKSIYLELRRLKQASKYLNQSSLKTLASSFVLSRLDYCNSLFAKLPCYQVERLQKLQNYAARIIFNKPRREHVTPLLLELHWLPVSARIDYKIAMLIFKSLNNLAPPYIKALTEPYIPIRPLRSGSKNLLVNKVCHYKTVGERSFSFYAPFLWNKLPQHLRDECTIDIFKSNLKTYLFRLSYNL